MWIEAPILCILGQITIMEHGPSAPFIHIPTYMGEEGKGFTTLPMKSIPKIRFSFSWMKTILGRKINDF
jgi:hypothetical protein